MVRNLRKPFATLKIIHLCHLSIKTENISTLHQLHYSIPLQQCLQTILLLLLCSTKNNLLECIMINNIKHHEMQFKLSWQHSIEIWTVVSISKIQVPLISHHISHTMAKSTISRFVTNLLSHTLTPLPINFLPFFFQLLNTWVIWMVYNAHNVQASTNLNYH